MTPSEETPGSKQGPTTHQKWTRALAILAILLSLVAVNLSGATYCRFGATTTRPDLVLVTVTPSP